ncbi:tRNA dimethylallyltransferase 2 isoform X1 [Sorghum bicolor]|uniref:tRNA dimethylallyltransferase n=1 Tax=Sorghum bicolor TaxID=4558 RepID=C5XJC3_SORBI|nr:tRNA dimethylallyltransferase 2 isoform X1 [Sorghum bicolor]EES02135.1 hypothetical protein SORBI_3003G442000 [Sorghum bicolor]|eukprot:XP_002457015.1 tRNA dimethylallyltransferase 2 isoform X1 [Sorghum bicolor]
MADPSAAAAAANPSPGAGEEGAACSPPSPSQRGRGKVVIVMGATGAGKSRLAVDLAAHFAGVEVVSADSMQLYRGLDVLTNKVPLHEQNGVPHHLLSVIDPSVEFTCHDFRDHAVPIIQEILDRGGLPVIVGGTNFYIQSLVSPFLFDDMAEEMHDCTLREHIDDDRGLTNDDEDSGYERLKDIDPVAAQRIHPNDHRKIKRYLELYATTGSLPSDLFQGEAAKKWGRPSNSRFDCCFLWVDADLQALDSYVNKRVDCMMDAGLLNEVCNIYDADALYTQGLRQAIGVREFDEFFRLYLPRQESGEDSSANLLDIHDDQLKSLLDEAVSQLKANTRRLVRRQRRRLHRLGKDFGWNLHHFDATEAFCCATGDSWQKKVVEPCVDVVKRFLSDDSTVLPSTSASDGVVGSVRGPSRELWTQYVCEACDNRVLRGAHEWEQHKQGRGHRKRVQRLKQKSLRPRPLLSQDCN